MALQWILATGNNRCEGVLRCDCTQEKLRENAALATIYVTVQGAGASHAMA
ncbi:hypothetical protein JMF94_02340 [Desulfovibrio sp. UIB00]|uniref:hypothetical protein n=1 Tax=Desulfovibrio sp. UIB00 TaxID=2804314 RepID=UPI001F0FAEF9|nr:hypothetical protein [Desulfovibrio sp. UIB00]MCH5143919.1 hypothetical protein [Desulfovibrio sp. UIB00]